MYGKRIPITFTPVTLTFETREEFEAVVQFLVFVRDHSTISAFSSISSEMIDSLDAA